MPVSEKQKKILAFPYSDYDGLISTGAVRTGKSEFSMIAAVDFVMRNYDGCNAIIAGKTVTSAVKNLIRPFMKLSYVRKKYSVTYNSNGNKMVVKYKGRENIFYVYGGGNRDSADFIQGLTACCAVIDEAVLLDENFVSQCLARLSIEGSKFFITCNPGSQENFIYTDYILKAEDKNLLVLSFELRDNPSLSEKTLKRYESSYTGSFYDKFIKGMWVNPEGLVYQIFDKTKHIASEELLNLAKPRPVIRRRAADNGATHTFTYVISVDYGITNPFAAILWAVNDSDGTSIAVKEFYYDCKEHNGLKKTDEELYSCLYNLSDGYDIDCVIVDPSATSFIETIHRHDYFEVHKANNSVIQGISYVTTAFSKGLIYISPKCDGLIHELGLYSWDEDSTCDAVLKVNDHACDSMRYFFYTYHRKHHGLSDEEEEDE